MSNEIDHISERRNKIEDILKSQDFPKIVSKPWGEEWILAYNRSYCFKKIKINAGHATSLQYHDTKRETNYIQKGRAKIWVKNSGEQDFTIYNNVGEGFSLNLNPGDIHRIEAIEDLLLFETSTPEIWDVIRLEDGYGREGTNNP